MKEIVLSQGKVAIVDDEDFEWLNQWKWSALKSGRKYYAVRNARLPSGKRIAIRMHRAILGLEYSDPRVGDHIKHDGLNNRRDNLRIVSQQENQWNQEPTKGYYWNKTMRKYLVQIAVDGIQRSIGYSDTEEGARNVYLQAKHELHHIPSRLP